MKVCLIVEGAYPYVVGGVSVWVHQLIQHLPHIRFVLWTISAESGLPHKYKLPSNVVELKEIALDKKLRFQSRRPFVQKIWKQIQAFHRQMDEGQFNQFHHFVHHFLKHNPDRIPLENIFKDYEGWDLIKEMYSKHHPISPFVQYYWTWRATHIPLFKLLQADIPDADLYHAVSTGYAGFLGAIAKIHTGRPFILTEHGIYAKEREMEINQSGQYQGYQKKMWKHLFFGLSKISYEYADLIIALFQKNQRLQIKLGAPPERCHVIPNGVQVEAFLRIKPQPHDTFNVGFIGRMVPIKDVKTFVLAARMVADALPNARFYLIGPQDERSDYVRELHILIGNLGLSERITFTGKVDVKAYFPLLDVLCLTSVKEAQPLSIIEAMLAGVPVVATRVGDVEDILQHHGIVVPPKRPDKLAEGIIRFARDSEFRRSCVEKGRERAYSTYNLKDLIQRYAEIYQDFGKREAA